MEIGLVYLRNAWVKQVKYKKMSFTEISVGMKVKVFNNYLDRKNEIGNGEVVSIGQKNIEIRIRDHKGGRAYNRNFRKTDGKGAGSKSKNLWVER